MEVFDGRSALVYSYETSSDPVAQVGVNIGLKVAVGDQVSTSLPSSHCRSAM